MSAEVEGQDQQKEPKFAEQDGCKLNETVGEKLLWPQPALTDVKTESGDNASVKSTSIGVPGFIKEDDKSSTETLGSGNIWSQKTGLQSDGMWPHGQGGLDWSISGDGISKILNKDGNKGYPWGGSVMQDSNGTTNALSLSHDFWKPSSLLSGGYSSSSASGGWGDSRGNNWGIPDLKSEFNKEGLPDKKIGSEQDRTKGIWNTTEEKKVEPIGPVQRRSASLTELNVTFESSSLGQESVKFPSTGKMGLNDERSQPDGAEGSQQNREELIAKMINSNDGWGKRPISQDTPWHMDAVTGPPPADPLPPAADDSGATKNDVFWNVHKEPNTPGWNNNQSTSGSSYEWAPDSDIGMWNGPPPPESVNPNMWTGPPKEANTMWIGGQMGQTGLDKGMLQSGAMSWGDNRGFQGTGIDKFQKEFGRDDRLRGTDTWGQQAPRGTYEGSNWTSGDTNTWGIPHPADQNDSWNMKQTLNNFPSSGFGAGGKPDPIQKIGMWGEGTVTETGLWNQPQSGSNMQVQLQQLIDLGLKKEDVLMLQNNMGMDKLLDLMKLQKEAEQPKGRIIRGKSVDMPSSDPFGQFQGGRSSGFQAGNRGSGFQPPAPGGLGPQMHMKSSGLQQSTGGWGNIGTQLYGRTLSVPTANSSLIQQPMPQMSPQMMQSLLHLQSVLQPLLHQRSQVQHNRNLTPFQKNLQIEQLNIHINDIKQRIDQVQLSFGPPPGTVAAPGMMMNAAGGLGATDQLGIDEVKMMQLLGQLKLDRDFGSLGHTPLGTVAEQPFSEGNASVGTIPNMTADQMAVLMGGSNRWMGQDPSSNRDKLPAADILTESWPNIVQGGSGGLKMGWPTGDFMAPKGTRPPPPPGLGNCDKTDVFWNQHAVNRSTSWAPGEKLKTSLQGQLGMSSNWLMLKNIASTTDPAVLQKICLTYGPVQNLYYNKALGQVLACYINRDDVLNALSSISQSMVNANSSSRLSAEPVAVEEIGRLIDSTWTPIPPSSTLFGAALPSAKTGSVRSGSNGWGMDSM